MDKNKLTPWEARINLSEMREKVDPKHIEEVEKKISEAIYEQTHFDFGELLQKEYPIDEK